MKDASRISFTQAAMYHLAALNTLLRRERGRIYRLRNEAEVVHLLMDAKSSTDPKVAAELATLRARLWDEEAIKLDKLLTA